MRGRTDWALDFIVLGAEIAKFRRMGEAALQADTYESKVRPHGLDLKSHEKAERSAQSYRDGWSWGGALAI